MSTYTNSAELQGKTLEEDDTVIFSVEGQLIEYSVKDDYLFSLAPHRYNDRIFELLKLDKYTFCSLFYTTRNGNWPSVYLHTTLTAHQALTNCVLALFGLIEQGKDPNIILFNSLK